MARYLLDTNAVIHIRQRHPPAVVSRLEQIGREEVALSAVTYGELIYGAEKSRRREWNLGVIAQLVTLLPVLPLPKEAGDAYGALRTTLERRGEVIGNDDLWIAAHAIVASLILVTNNERELRRVPGPLVENWTR
jgi:tRNA(fMet)-specific endonuclease VapC